MKRTVLPPGHVMLRYTHRTSRPGWYVAVQTGCLVRFEGPFPTEEAARASAPAPPLTERSVT